MAIDSTVVLRTKGGLRHKKDREVSVVPRTPSSTPTRAGRSPAAWVGLRVEAASSHERGRGLDTAGRLAHPRKRRRQPDLAPLMSEALPQEACFVLGASHYNARNAREGCAQGESFLVASRRGEPYPHTDSGAEVRRVFLLRHIAR